MLLKKEDLLQSRCVQWFRKTYPQYRILSIPNGGARHPATAARLKITGVLPGVPDLFIPVAKKAFHGLWVELKYGNGRPSPAQREMIDFLAAQGYCAPLCRSFDEFKTTVRVYLDE